MGHVYTELPAIPVPADCNVNGKSRQVSRYYYVNGKRRRHVLGLATDDGMMHANDVFRTYYPAEWESAFGDRAPGAGTLMAGLYVAFLAIGWNSGLYPVLWLSLGPSSANVFMDLALYLIRHKNSTMQDFSDEMARQVLFSRKAWSPAFISDFLARALDRDALDGFRDRWYAERTENGRRKVWLSVDGTGMDPQLARSEPAAHEHSKPNGSAPVFSYTWAVDASDGTPLTWFVNPENTPACKAFDGILRDLDHTALDVKGVILDPGFATPDVLEPIRARGLDYIVMLGNNLAGFASMMDRHGEELRNLLANGIDKAGLVSARVDRAQVFQESDLESHVALYCSSETRTRRTAELFAKAMDAIDAAERNIALGNDVSFPEDVREFLSLERDASGNVLGVIRDQKKFDEALHDSGYFAIASSAARTAREILDIYDMRAASKCPFDSLKSRMGLDTACLHGDVSVRGGLALGFVAAALENEFKKVCRELDLDADEMLDALDGVVLQRMPNGDYEATADHSQTVGLLLSQLGVGPDHLKQVAVDLGAEAKEGLVDEMRELRAVVARRGRGRVKGSKNRKTLEREAREAELREKGLLPPKRPRGRPKSRKTLEREAREAELRARDELPEKRGPGRPKGGKNRKTLEREGRMARAAARIEKKRAAEAAKAGIDGTLDGARTTGIEEREA